MEFIKWSVDTDTSYNWKIHVCNSLSFFILIILKYLTFFNMIIILMLAACSFICWLIYLLLYFFWQFQSSIYIAYWKAAKYRPSVRQKFYYCSKPSLSTIKYRPRPVLLDLLALVQPICSYLGQQTQRTQPD